MAAQGAVQEKARKTPAMPAFAGLEQDAYLVKERPQHAYKDPEKVHAEHCRRAARSEHIAHRSASLHVNVGKIERTKDVWGKKKGGDGKKKEREKRAEGQEREEGGRGEEGKEHET